MEYQLESDEFTTWTLLEYLKLAFGAQINGKPFAVSNILFWVRTGKLPESYGGHRIYEAQRYKELNNILTFRVEHLNREEIEEMIGQLDHYAVHLKSKQRVAESKKRGRKKVRTELYYQMLPERKRRGTVVPNNYAELGISKKQFK